MKKGVWIVVLTCLALIFAGAVLVSAADAAAPGDALYGLDRGAENLRLSLAFTPQQAAQIYQAQAAERLQEVQALVQRGDTQHLDQALVEAGAAQDLAAGQEPEKPGKSKAEKAGKTGDQGDDDQQGDDDDQGEDDDDQGGQDKQKGPKATPPGLAKKAGGEAPGQGKSGKQGQGSGDGDANTNDAGSGDEGDDGNENETGEDGDVREDPDLPRVPKSSPVCDDPATPQHPALIKMAEEYGVAYADLAAWYCQGLGVGEIKLAYDVASNASLKPGELLALRLAGKSWGEIMKLYDIHGKGKPKKKP